MFLLVLKLLLNNQCYIIILFIINNKSDKTVTKTIVFLRSYNHCTNLF